MPVTLKIVAYLLLFKYTIAVPAEKGSDSDGFNFIILHNNDMHARFEQTNAFSSRCKEEDVKNNKCYGGFARVAHLVRDYRRKADAGEIPKVLYLNAGDTYTGTPWFSLFKDNITATFLELLRPDAISLGNHEFDEGAENLAMFLNEIDFPVLAANLILDKEPQLKNKNLKPSHVFTIDGTKIGIVGYLTPETKELATSSNVEYIDEVDAIIEESGKLKNEGVNIIIALGHSGIERDKQIAEKCPHVDLVIGGHSHTFLYDGEKPDIEVPYDTYPVTIVQKSGKKVPVVQTYAYTKYLGYLNLEFDKDGNLVQLRGRPILLNGTIEREQDVLKMLELYRPAVLALQKEVVGFTRVHLDGSCRRRECNLGNFIADSMVDWNAKKYNGKGWTDAAVGIMQGGGIRASIEKNSNGITMEDLQTVSPFGSKVVVIEVTGETLLEALEHSVDRYTEGEERGEFLQYSGLYVDYDMNQPSQKRVVNVKVLCAYCDVPMLENIVPTNKYRVVSQDYLANGGDGYSMFKGSQLYESETLDIDVLKEYLKKKSPIYPAIEWRIKIKDLINPSEDILGYTRVYLEGGCYRAECNLGNFITDAIIDWHSLNYATETAWTDSSIALIPANNIKHSIDNKVKSGEISRKDAMDILPLDNKIVNINISGRILKEVLEHSVHRYTDGLQPPEFLQMSGIQVEYDLRKEVGNRVKSVKIVCSTCLVPQLENIDVDKLYKILIPANLIDSNLGYRMLKREQIFKTFETTELDVFVNFLRRKSPIYPTVEWRITLFNVDPSQDIVGNTRVLLSNDCIMRECNLGNVITDSMVDWYALNYDGKGWTDASIAILQGSKIKFSIDASKNKGNIFRHDVENVFDPSYNLQTMTLKGSELLSLLEYSVSTYGEANYMNFLQTSGINVVFDLSKPSGHRVIDLKVTCSHCDIPELKPINATENYKIIAQSILYADDYHDVFNGRETKDLGETDMNVFLQYLKKKSIIYPAIEWRTTIINNKNDEVTNKPETTTLAATNLNVSHILVIISTLLAFLYSNF